MKMGEIVDHPAARLMTEVNAEREIASAPEAVVLQDAIFEAVFAYYKYLDSNGLFYDADRDLLRASGLHVIHNGMDCDIRLKDGAIDRRYGGGEDPDPEG